MLKRVTAEPQSQPHARVILLGASNLTRGISTVVESCRLMLGSPIEILAALGHGRSYGMDSSVFVRTMPGILQCGIWDALNQRRHQSEYALSAQNSELSTLPPTFALITDIGNDIMYGAPPHALIGWINECIDRLAALNARVALSMIPIESVRALKPWQFKIVKSILYPTRGLTFAQAIDRAIELHAGLQNLAHARRIPFIESSPQWYGFDPIHIRMKHWPQAWRKILATSFRLNEHEQPLARSSLARWAKLRVSRPESWRLIGIESGKPQPGLKFADGTTVGLY
jgi:hypothetical protein